MLNIISLSSPASPYRIEICYNTLPRHVPEHHVVLVYQDLDTLKYKMHILEIYVDTSIVCVHFIGL